MCVFHAVLLNITNKFGPIMECDLCGEKMDRLEYNCRRCGNVYCPKHRLPESHDCIGLKIEKAERALKRKENEAVPWFKDGFRLSNVGKEESRTSSTGRRPDDPIASDDKYRAANTSEECSTCGTGLFEHEAAGCPHCGEIYCGDHLSEHRRNCSHRDPESVDSAKTVQEHYQKRTREKQEELRTRADELEAERKRRYSSPNMNLDGSLEEPEYEEDIQSIGGDGETDVASPGGVSTTTFAIAVVMLAVAAGMIFLFISL